ncbi:MAG: hypothetical protein HC806_02930 [Anaerolineae bacterium]|nr:hypothetical protein [Anaerolineae bacterium]
MEVGTQRHAGIVGGRHEVNRLLDPHTLGPISITPTSKKTIMEAAPGFKVQIFYTAHAIRSENWETNKSLMERTIPIFEALIESDTNGLFHRNYGQLGYALKDKIPPDYARARAALTKAIELRDKKGQAGFQLYELNRAICNILLDANFQANKPSGEADKHAILADLNTCMDDIKAGAAVKASAGETGKPKEVAKTQLANG